jgi:uncharacterized protein (DUF934 family)
MKLLTQLPAASLLLPNDADPCELHLPAVDSIALQFPKWTDGRAYSQAWLLRARQRFAGELVASGDVVVDMLPLLHRTGFTAVVLRADQSAQTAARLLNTFSGHYQADVHEALPAFARLGTPADAPRPTHAGA